MVHDIFPLLTSDHSGRFMTETVGMMINLLHEVSESLQNVADMKIWYCMLLTPQTARMNI